MLLNSLNHVAFCLQSFNFNVQRPSDDQHICALLLIISNVVNFRVA